MSKFVNGYLLEYRIGDTYCTVTKGHKDQFNRFIGEVMVFRSESWDECIEWANNN